MKINRLHTIIGLLLVIVPFTDFTRGFKYGVSVISGIIIVYFAMRSIHLEITKKQSRHRKHDSFVESKPKHIAHTEKPNPVVTETPVEETQVSETPEEVTPSL